MASEATHVSGYLQSLVVQHEVGSSCVKRGTSIGLKESLQEISRGPNAKKLILVQKAGDNEHEDLRRQFLLWSCGPHLTALKVKSLSRFRLFATPWTIAY